MRVKISTEVGQDYRKVWEKFDDKLFVALNPAFPKVKVLQFQGCDAGNETKVELNFLLFKTLWTADITASGETENSIYFVDEGARLPFFLKYWRHEHIIRKKGRGSEIIDDIVFKAPNKLLSFLLYPFIWFQFRYRKPVYKRIFSEKPGNGH